MTSFELNVMVALYWGGEIITDMNGFRYTECARMIISMPTSTNYVELVGLLHEKMGTNSENIHMDISGKYPCSIQEQIVQPPFQQLSMHGHRSFGEGSSSQMHIDNSHKDYEARDNETNVDLYNDVNAEISDESSEEDEPPKDGDESESDEDIDVIREFFQNDVNLHNHKQGVSEIQNHGIPYFRTLENEEDIFMSTCESEMEYCSAWSEEAKKDLKKDLSRLMWRAASAHQVRKFESLMWQIREENVEAHEYLIEIPLDKWTVTDRMGGLARNFVSEHFTIENYVATYSGSFSPIGHEAYWPSPSFTMRSNEFYRCPNRPRTTRIPNEMDHGSTVYERACGLCRQTGHDRRRCPNLIYYNLLRFTSNQLRCHGVGEVRSEQREEEECQKEGMKKSRNQAERLPALVSSISTHAARGSMRNQVSGKAMAEKEDRFTFRKRKLH
ncbi:hypothetical protein H5410_026521 [Solanum commersonii]|uniref:CCHC-type domain-containing protein n=1 Tax=Solanum commersonii TaxID=4109 RepID=A0A9J5YYT7_SOLCO|nr:hypothetical protein H5410_026521 [Solanum commersonii]